MMTSVGPNRARGNWDQTQTQHQPQQKQRPQATAEQIRIAQMISDHNDADFEEKVKQLIDITGKNQDECMIALHDCNGDVNRAINVLLEGNPDTDSWEMVGKKKSLAGPKETGLAEASEENKEMRDRDREFSRRRVGGGRRGRGTSRGREFRGQENGLDGAKSSGTFGRASERGRRGRGRGRGLGRRGGRFSAQGMGTFNPADYTDPASTDEYYGNPNPTWNSAGTFEPDDGTSAWRTVTEEWGTDDWSEDPAPGTTFLSPDDKRNPPKAVNGCYQLSETKIFTASNVGPLPSGGETLTITAGQRIDLAVLLGKQPSVSENEPAPLDTSASPTLSQPLVFNNSKQHSVSQPSPPTTFPQHNMVSMLGKNFGDVGEPKGGSTAGSQLLEQLKTAQALAQLAAQHTQPTSNAASSWDMGPTSQPSALSHFELKSQTEPPVHSPFSQRQSYSNSSMMEVFIPSKQPTAAPSSPLQSKAGTTQVSPGASENQSSSPQPTQQKLKPPKKKASIASKIPSSAVEMPASADIAGLNLQFGALQFGSEPMLAEYEATPATSVAASQPQSSPYTGAVSESSSTIPSNQSQESGYQPSTITTSAFTTQNSAPGPQYEQSSSQRAAYSNSLSSSPQKDLTQAKNGFSTIQTSQSIEAAAGSAVKSDSPAVPSMASLSNAVSASSLLTSSSQHPAGLTNLSHTEELPSTTTPQQSSTASTQQSSSLSSSSGRSSTSTHLHTSVESEACLHSSPSTFATAASTVSVAPSSSVSNTLGSVSSLNLSLVSNSTVTAASRSTVATTSGKAPPNLPPGVPPLLPNPYIVAPGLLPAYQPQVYGYDDLQMLQTRFPLDYYGIPFAAPTTPITGREASLTNNPYSGDLTKFGRGDASSPAPATTLAQPQQNQTQSHHTTQQTFLNPALPPGYSYTSLPYYAGVPGLPNTFQYGPAMFAVPPTSSKQHGVNVNAPATAFQQASGYGTHGYSTAGVSVTSSNTGVPDISGSVYSKTQQSFEKQGFHTGTPAASFNLPSALGSAGPVNPATAAGYPPPFMHILAPHQQQMHSQILHLQQDGQSGTGQRTQTSSIQQKSQGNKSAYNSSGYWGPN
ncbi:ubiquitin-associated protein 2-like isoform X3 [Hemiscyllium ocellatum]|uniref:ubiquitin-associated protein 2-like isoform X3 n=1 Tax=Hemiscyllium ocellatum TaxID=170820 RepID=UPI0029677A25|nr:ubiquitin-associated protein 2-like isoform X3 [Hemiscyllium ocellatum]